MHVMQYEIGLPADYDMRIIEDRVATRGKATDAFPYLGLKAYAVRTRGRRDDTVNVYAPFYFWVDPRGMNEFLYGPFRSITTDFGRPRVRNWVGAAFHRGPGFDATPVFATREITHLAPDQEPGPLLDVEPRGITGTVHSQAIAVDPGAWEVVRFTLWTQPQPVPGFDVLHVSAPHLGELPTGRLW